MAYHLGNDQGVSISYKEKIKEGASDFADDVAAPAVDSAKESAKDTLGEIVDFLTTETEEVTGKAAKATKKRRKRIPQLAARAIPGVVPKKKVRRGRMWGFVWGAVIGATLVYLFDSDKGEERRRQLLITLGIEDEKWVAGRSEQSTDQPSSSGALH